MPTDMWSLMNMAKADVRRKFPVARRFLDQGFDLDPKHHQNDELALISPNQNLRLNLVTGDINHQSKEQDRDI